VYRLIEQNLGSFPLKTRLCLSNREMALDMTDTTYKKVIIAQALKAPQPNLSRPVGGQLKQAIDVVLAIAALIILSPVLAAIWLIVTIVDGSPAVIRHKRVGYNGQQFDCLKFRTMVLNSDQIFQDYLRHNTDAIEQWVEKQKLAPDPRVTLLGCFLRKTSLDELPQLWNVLRGEMSLIGPRPVTFQEIKRYGVSASDYFRARPGITGLWQVSGRSRLPYETRVELDKTYVRTWSVWKDLLILIRTMPCLFDTEASA
jgi:exopolysaccharide production protein ExoY